MNEQMNLALGDELQKWSKIAREYCARINQLTGCTPYVFRTRTTNGGERWWLGYRDFNYDVTHHYQHALTWEVAQHLVQSKIVMDWESCVRNNTLYEYPIREVTAYEVDYKLYKTKSEAVKAAQELKNRVTT